MDGCLCFELEDEGVDFAFDVSAVSTLDIAVVFVLRSVARINYHFYFNSVKSVS